MTGFAQPGTVVLQATINLVRIAVIDADMVELRHGKVAGLPPLGAAVVGVPDATVVAGDDVLGVRRVNPKIVDIAVHAREAADGTETPARIVADDQCAVSLE